ncbi:recombination protein O N-terminal domain-containing protein [Flavobacteriales bacterium]|nr:recombination protein O N-terminal domain-containing protein [Flavobacteriales bacterium]
MNYESRAIALLNHKYGEGAVIAKVFTEEYGLKSFSVKRNKSKKSKNKILLLDKMNLLTINAKNNSKKEIQYLSEINLAYAYQNTSLKNKLIRLFIAEVLSKALIDSERNINLFQFIWDTNTQIDNLENVNNNFCIIFLIQLSKFLGISPSTENIDLPYFNLYSGNFTNIKNKNEEIIKGEIINYFKRLIIKENVIIPYQSRQELIKILFRYYSIHHINLSNIKSYEVIESLS